MLAGVVFTLYGNFVTVGPLLTEYSMIGNTLNIIIVPTLLAFYHVLLVAIVWVMHMSLIQNLTEKIENVPLIDVEKWAFDTVLLYRKFKDMYSIPLFVTISQK